MKKFAVFSGFLGSGKTTTMIALTKYFTAHYGKAAMISNDLGSQGLADNRLADFNGCLHSELTGDCICYQTNNLVNRLNDLFLESGCELVISDIPGFGIGALDHVYHTLNEKFPAVCDLAPFTVLCEPYSLRILKNNEDTDLCYILKSQLLEADLIVLNKCDLMTQNDLEKSAVFLKSINPHAKVIVISALTGDGLDNLAQFLIHHKASMRKPDLQYGGKQFLSSMGGISEYNIQYYAVICCNDFDGTNYLSSLSEEISHKIKSEYFQIPHLKLLAWQPDGDYGKVDLLGSERPSVITKAFSGPCTELAVILNASAFCKPHMLDSVITDSVCEISRQYELEVTIFKKECFPVLEES